MGAVSLLDRGPHTLMLQKRRPVDGPHGTTLQNVGKPVPVMGAFQPVSATETSNDGVIASVTRRFISRSFSGDVYSLLTDSRGAAWDVVGEPQVYDMSPRTSHVEVLLRRADGVGAVESG